MINGLCLLRLHCLHRLLLLFYPFGIALAEAAKDAFHTSLAKFDHVNTFLLFDWAFHHVLNLSTSGWRGNCTCSLGCLLSHDDRKSNNATTSNGYVTQDYLSFEPNWIRKECLVMNNTSSNAALPIETPTAAMNVWKNRWTTTRLQIDAWVYSLGNIIARVWTSKTILQSNISTTTSQQTTFSIQARDIGHSFKDEWIFKTISFRLAKRRKKLEIATGAFGVLMPIALRKANDYATWNANVTQNKRPLEPNGIQKDSLFVGNSCI